MYSIYLLTCPDTNTPIYVGLTKLRLGKRLSLHIQDGKKRTHPVCKYIKTLTEKGIRPTIKLIEQCDDLKTAEEKEVAHLALYKAKYSTLLNISKGGLGASYKKSETERKAISDRMKLLKKSKEWIKKIATSQGKAVLQYDLNGDFISEYYSVNEAARTIKCSPSGLATSLKSYSGQYKGFMFKYKDEYIV